MKKSWILIGISVATVLLLILGYIFVYKDIFNKGDDSNTISHTELNKEQDADTGFKIPDYDAKDIRDIYPDILEKASNWSSDYRIFSITGTTRYIMNGGEQIYYGTDEGKFSSWMVEIYSPSKRAYVMYSYSGDSSSLSEDVPVTNDYVLPAYASRAFFNDLEDIKSTKDVLDLAISKGLNTQDTNVYIYMGDQQNINKYGARYIWRVDERSNKLLNENGFPLINNSFFIDSKTLEFLTTSKL